MTPSALAQVQTALSRSDYRNAISAAASVPQTELDQEDVEPLLDAILTAAAGLEDNSDDELQAYELVVDIGDSLSRKRSEPPGLESRVTRALYNKGVVLTQRGRGEEAIAVYDDLVRRYGSSVDLTHRLNTVRAMFNKGNGLLRMNRPHEAILEYDEIVRQFASDPSPEMREAVGKALVNKGIALGQLRRYHEAVEVLDAVVRGWADCTDTSVCERAAKALINKATALYYLGRLDEALSTYDTIVSRFSEDARPSLQSYVRMALARRRNVADQVH